jgi:hypothetical protein
MTTDPNQIRAEISAILAQLPDIDPNSGATHEFDIDAVAQRLEEAHDVLVRALESVEKG